MTIAVRMADRCPDCAGVDGACPLCLGSGVIGTVEELDAEDIATRREEHLRERIERLGDARDPGDWWRGSKPLNEAELACGCAGRAEEDTDGENVWPIWTWTNECAAARGERE